MSALSSASLPYHLHLQSTAVHDIYSRACRGLNEESSCHRQPLAAYPLACLHCTACHKKSSDAYIGGVAGALISRCSVPCVYMKQSEYRVASLLIRGFENAVAFCTDQKDRLLTSGGLLRYRDAGLYVGVLFRFLRRV